MGFGWEDINIYRLAAEYNYDSKWTYPILGHSVSLPHTIQEGLYLLYVARRCLNDPYRIEPERRGVHIMGKIRLQIAPDVEFKMDLEVEGIDSGSRDYNVQQHKADVYQEFEQRLKKVFPEGVKIDRFEFGLSLDTDG